LFDNAGCEPVFAAWLPFLVLLPLIALLARGAARRG